jgi:hypothetical protein
MTAVTWRRIWASGLATGFPESSVGTVAIAFPMLARRSLGPRKSA